MQMTGLDIDRFLSGAWQKQPLLIRNPWKRWANVLEPDELAGLACEEGVESRLIRLEAGRLVMEQGPIPEARFGQLSADQPWTLLVQAVDHHTPEVAALIEPFRFIPDWRIDDVMVSYATDGGGVGPHYDQYDVFLVQGLGKRRWRVGPKCSAATPLLEHEDLRLIAPFEATGDWVLEPGDILYVPPGFAHEGTAVGDDCMTYSIGFRAPSRAELVEGWAEHQADGLGEDDRYADPGLKAATHPGEITPEAIDRLHAMVMEAMADRDGFARWFGLYNSLPKYAEADWRPDEPVEPEEVRAMLAAGAPLSRNPASRFSFVRQGEGLMLFVDGHCFDCAGDATTVAKTLCGAAAITIDPALAMAVPVVSLIAALVNQGSLAFGDGD